MSRPHQPPSRCRVSPIRPSRVPPLSASSPRAAPDGVSNRFPRGNGMKRTLARRAFFSSLRLLRSSLSSLSREPCRFRLCLRSRESSLSDPEEYERDLLRLLRREDRSSCLHRRSLDLDLDLERSSSPRLLRRCLSLLLLRLLLRSRSLPRSRRSSLSLRPASSVSRRRGERLLRRSSRSRSRSSRRDV